MNRPNPGQCPVCGYRLAPKALSCPECGADERAGWNEESTSLDGLDLPGDDFSYDSFLEKEFGQRKKNGRGQWTRIALTGGVLAALLLYLVFR